MIINLLTCISMFVQVPAPSPAAQDAEQLPVLRPGDVVEGVVEESAPETETEAIRSYRAEPALTRRCRLELPADGPYHLEVRSYFFDPYQVLRDGDGNLLAEDGNGLVGLQSRLVLPSMKRDQDYRLEVCALYGGTGAFEVRFLEGTPATLSLAEQRAALLDDARKRVQVLEAARGVDHPDNAGPLDALGEIHLDQGTFREARPYFERALRIREENLGPDHPDTAVSLNNVARVCLREGRYAEARGLVQRTLEIREEALGPEHPDTSVSLNNLASILERQGKLDEARPLYERALRIIEKTYGPDHLTTAILCQNLARLIRYQGYYSEARPMLERVIRIYERTRGPEHVDTASGLAELLDVQGNYDEALPLYERALRICEEKLGPDHPQTLPILASLASCLENQGKVDKALPLLERALRGYETTFGPEHPSTATCLDRLGMFLDRLGRYSEAQEVLERALRIFEETLGVDHARTANCASNLASCFQSQGDYDEARVFYERALRVREQTLGPRHPTNAISLDNLAWLLDDAGDPAAAWSYATRGLAVQLEHLGDAWESQAEYERILHQKKEFWYLEVLLALATREGAPDHAPREVYDHVLRWKGQISRSMRSIGERKIDDCPEEVRPWIDELRKTNSRLSKEAYRQPYDISDATEHQKLLRAIGKERFQLERRIAAAIESADVSIEKLANLAPSIPEGCAVVDFLVHKHCEPAVWRDGELVHQSRWLGEQLSAWVIRHGDPEPIRIHLGSARAVMDRVDAFLDVLRTSRGVVMDEPDDPLFEQGGLLREALWTPIEEHLQGVDKIIVSPDGFLGRLPFEVIPVDDGAFLLERYSVSYLQDVASLARILERKPQLLAGNLLVAGDVNYSKRDDQPEPVAGDEESRGFAEFWPRLAATRLECQTILELHEGCFGGDGSSKGLYLSKSAATEERLKAEMGEFQIIHLATHGFFSPEGVPSLAEVAETTADSRRIQFKELRVGMESTPESKLENVLPGLLSSVVLSGANFPDPDREDDGLLTATETAWLDLEDCELVVLSACETSLGAVKVGEGMIGLRRAFRLAGAETVISSLWSVDDESTSDLMRKFYINIWRRRMSRGEALRQAQLSILREQRSTPGEAVRPYHWGAFVLDGDWR